MTRGVAAVLAAATVAGGGALVPSAAPAAGGRVPASTPLVELRADRVARTRPDSRSRRIETVAARRPLTRVRTRLPVLDRRTGRGGRRWLQVRLPGRPNQHKGWIPAARTRALSTPWRLTVDLSARQVTAFRDGRMARRFRAVIGTPSTPTPRGHYFVEEAVALASSDAGGPYALATSARSEVLQEFAGGPGQIALHGTNHLSDPMGSAASHGCVRVTTAAITWLAGRIDRGVPLVVKP